MSETEIVPTSFSDRARRLWADILVAPLRRYVEALSPSDRIVFYTLSLIVGAASLVSLYALEQHFLVTIPSYGGSLSEGSIGSPQFINPILAISDADRDLSALTYAGLMGLSGDGQLIPVIANHYAISDDRRIYTFTLKRNAAFSDGTPITADDVVFTIQRAQDPAIKSPAYADWAGVTVVALDPYTVKITLPKPYAPFLSLTTLGILPSRLWKHIVPSEFPFTTLETSPVGAGPFAVREVTRDVSGLIKRVSLTANPHYPLGRPYLDTMTITFYPNADELTRALRSGGVESAYDLPGGERDLTTRSAPYARVFGVFWNPGENQVFTRPEIREALSLAVNRRGLVADVLGGYATPIMGPVPPGRGIVQATVPSSPTPTADAAHVLQSTGWTYNGSEHAWQNAATKQSFDHLTIRTSNVPELKSVANAVKADWERLGVRVDVELYEPGDLSQNVIRPRKYEALLYGEVIGRDQDLYAFWDSQERNDPGLNIASYVNKTVDTLLEDARGSADETERLADLQKIEDMVAAEYPAAFLYAPDFTYTVPASLKGVRLPQIVTPSDRFADVSRWYRVTDRVWPMFSQ